MFADIAKNNKARSIDENAESADAQHTAKQLANGTVYCPVGTK